MNQNPNVSSTNTTPAQSAPRADEAALALKASVVSGAHDLTDKVKDAAGDLASQARSSVEDKLSGGKSRAVESLGDVADALRQTGEHLRSQDKTGLTRYISSAADKVDAASGYLKERSLGEVVGDVEQFARREPALFIGGAFVVGLVGGRFLKSSRPRLPNANGNFSARATSGTAQSSEGQRGSSQRKEGGHAQPSQAQNGGNPGQPGSAALRTDTRNPAGSSSSNAPTKSDAGKTQGGSNQAQGGPSPAKASGNM